MKIEDRKIDQVIPYDKNPRKNDHAVSKVAASIKAYGFRQPIVVDKAGVVIVGHTRLKAAISLGMKHVPVHVADLTPAQAKAYRIADNRVGEDADWDSLMLADELEDLLADDIDAISLGFDEGEVDELLSLGETPDFEPGTLDDQGKLDELEPKMVKCPHCKRDFDSRGHEQK